MQSTLHIISMILHDWQRSEQTVKEESLTDWLVYTIHFGITGVKCTVVPRKEEAKNGADIEVWVITNSYAYRFRIQAKKLHLRKNNPSIRYKNQMEDLIRTSKMDGAFPLYLFYSDVTEELMDQCGSNLCDCMQYQICKCLACCNGAFLSPADTVAAILPERYRGRDGRFKFIASSIPLSILDITTHYHGDPLYDIESWLNNLDTLYMGILSVDQSYQRTPYRFQYKHKGSLEKEDYVVRENQLPTIPDWVESILRTNIDSAASDIVPKMRHHIILDLRLR